MNWSKSKTLCKLWILPLTVLVFFVQGCATIKTAPVDPLAYKNRTKTIVIEDVTVTVAVPTIAEAQTIYGVDLAAKHIQPVWLEVKNDSADTYWFLPSGLDPDYFSPSEVTSPMDPHVGEARYDLAQDLAYSHALIKIGLIKGSGRPQSTAAEKASEDIDYTTDGLRVILVFGDRPASLEGIDFFDWERLADYR